MQLTLQRGRPRNHSCGTHGLPQDNVCGGPLWGPPPRIFFMRIEARITESGSDIPTTRAHVDDAETGQPLLPSPQLCSMGGLIGRKPHNRDDRELPWKTEGRLFLDPRAGKVPRDSGLGRRGYPPLERGAPALVARVSYTSAVCEESPRGEDTTQRETERGNPPRTLPSSVRKYGVHVRDSQLQGYRQESSNQLAKALPTEGHCDGGLVAPYGLG